MPFTFNSVSCAALAGTLVFWSPAGHAQTARDVITGYSDLALAMYSDSLSTAVLLDAAIEDFISEPTAQSHRAAKDAWLAARVPYQQTEAYRFGNPAVDDWEGKVNAWPLDEGLIDYVDPGFYGDASDENGFFLANIVANPSLTDRRNYGGCRRDHTDADPAIA